MRRWAEFVLAHRRLIIGGWLLVMVVGAVAAGSASKRLTVDFSLPGQPGTEAAHKIMKAFDNGGATNPYVVTVTMPQGERITGHEAEVAATFAAVAKANPDVRVVDEANTGDRAFRTPKDDRTAYALVFWRWDPSPSAQLPTARIEHAAATAAHTTLPGAVVGATGADVLAAGDSGGDGPGVLGETLIGAVGALLVLAFVFGSLLALLPLVVAAASILATFIMLLPVTYTMHVSVVVQFLIALVGLGIAIDYSLLVVTRWREERNHGRDNREAVVIAMETAGHAVLFSGVTVAIGLLALVVLPVPFMRSMGVGGALIPLASVLTTLSLTPAILGGIGPRIDWPRVRRESTASRAWSKWAAMIVRRRWISAVTAFAVLGVLVAALFGAKIGQASSDSLAKSGPAHDALVRLERGGVSSGIITPLEVLTRTDDAHAVADRVAQVDGVSAAVVPSDAASNRDGETVIVVLPEHETVNSKSVAVVTRVRDATAHLSGVLGVTGVGAAQLDFLHAVYGNFPLMLGVIAVLTYLLLARAFRSLLLPLKAVLLNLLSLAATLGAMVLFWQDGYGSSAIFGIHATGAVTFWIPMMVFAFLFGLSMDYEVFILARVREEYDGTRSTDAAVVEGIGRTGRLVTCAALILFLAFAALASGPGTDLKTLATALGIGILIDATIVRSVLVPALVSLFGRWNWCLPAAVARLLRVAPSAPYEDQVPGAEPELATAR
jgi:putative drug exporter of the RND superfamily